MAQGDRSERVRAVWLGHSVSYHAGEEDEEDALDGEADHLGPKAALMGSSICIGKR